MEGRCGYFALRYPGAMPQANDETAPFALKQRRDKSAAQMHVVNVTNSRGRAL